MAQTDGENKPNLFRAVLGHLGLFSRLERRVLGLLLSYALAIGLFSLIIPLTVQELVNTFSFAIQPVMVATLTIIMVAVLACVGALKALEFYTVELLQRRIFVRTSIAMTKQLPYIQLQGFKPWVSNYFMETVFMQRALSVLLVDTIHVVVGGAVGMTILLFYHPYFILLNMSLLLGAAVIFFILSHGGLRTTIAMSVAKYEVLHWIQEIAHNLLHLKATDSQSLLMQKTDQLVNRYVECRRARFSVLIRQYVASVGGQVLVHGGTLAIAGWLVSIGQLTIGQLVAVEVVVGGLLIKFDGLVKSVGHVYFLFTALVELDSVLSLPKDQRPSTLSVTLPDPSIHGIRVTCKGLTVMDGGTPLSEDLNLDVAPGEKIAIYARKTMARMSLVRMLAGLELPTSGVIHYNGTDLRHLDLSVVNQWRGFMPDSQLSLLEGTVEDNIVLGRSYIPFSDVRWALWFTELQEEIDALPLGVKTNIEALGEILAPTHILRILLARAIVMRPQLLIFDGMLHDLRQELREIILQRLCSKDESWTVIFVSSNPNVTPYIDRRIVLH